MYIKNNRNNINFTVQFSFFSKYIFLFTINLSDYKFLKNIFFSILIAV